MPLQHHMQRVAEALMQHSAPSKSSMLSPLTLWPHTPNMPASQGDGCPMQLTPQLSSPSEVTTEGRPRNNNVEKSCSPILLSSQQAFSSAISTCLTPLPHTLGDTPGPTTASGVRTATQQTHRPAPQGTMSQRPAGPRACACQPDCLTILRAHP